MTEKYNSTANRVKKKYHVEYDSFLHNGHDGDGISVLKEPVPAFQGLAGEIQIKPTDFDTGTDNNTIIIILFPREGKI